MRCLSRANQTQSCAVKFGTSAITFNDRRFKGALGKTTTQAAKEAEQRADELEKEIATLTTENNSVLEKLGERQRFREKMSELTQQALKKSSGVEGGGGAGVHVEPILSQDKKGIVAMLRAEIAMGGGIPSTIKAGGIAGGAPGDESSGIVDPMMPIRIHKTRNMPNPATIDNMLESSAAIGSSHINEIVLVGTVVKGAPVFGYLDGRVDITNTDDYFKTAGLQHAAKKDVLPTSSSSPSSPSSQKKKTSAGDVPFPVPVLQLTLRQIGFRPLGIYPATLRPALNYFTIQVRAPYHSSRIVEGDTVVVKGHYGLHALFQLDTSSWQTHPTVDVGPSGFIGVV